MTCTGVVFILAYLNCEMPAPSVQADTFCKIYKPVYWSKADTRQTKEQVDSNNRVWKKLCAGKK